MGKESKHCESFQERVRKWMLTCFGQEIADDVTERNHRFLEESLELVQSLGCTADEAHLLVDYVFGRRKGHPMEEAGDVRITLSALCSAIGLVEDYAASQMLTRNSDPERMARIRAKQETKPRGSPLPGSPDGAFCKQHARRVESE